MKRTTQWRTLSGAIVSRPLKEEITDCIRRELAAGHSLKVCIGTDSQVKTGSYDRQKRKLTEFATVIVFIRQGKGGFMYIKNDISLQQTSIKERMLIEVAKSIEVAFSLCEIFSRYGVVLELHADINTNPSFKSNTALQEAMGYILGMGFAFRAKPNAYASSCCANKMVQ